MMKILMILNKFGQSFGFTCRGKPALERVALNKLRGELSSQFREELQLVAYCSLLPPLICTYGIKLCSYVRDTNGKTIRFKQNEK